MRFEKAREILEHTRLFHIQLSKLYQFMSSPHNPEKVNLLLDYMVEHEKKMAETLETYEKKHSSGALDTWIQYAFEKDMLKIPNYENQKLKNSMEDIMGLSMKFSDELVDVYNQVQQQVADIEVKNIFTNLADMQNQQNKRLSIDYDRFMDL